MMDSSTGAIWLIGPIRLMAAATAVTASSSGTKAASSAPKARMRMIRVIGREVTSAFWKSSSKAWLSAFSALASPNSSMRKPACWRSSFATVARAGSTLSSASSPGSSKVTSADLPSSDREPWLPFAYGFWTFWTFLVFSSRATVVSTTSRNCASPLRAPFWLWIRTLSPDFSGKWSDTALSALPDSPMP